MKGPMKTREGKVIQPTNKSFHCRVLRRGHLE